MKKLGLGISIVFAAFLACAAVPSTTVQASSTVIGDIVGDDGAVTTEDETALIKNLIGEDTTVTVESVNGDTDIDIRDVVRYAKYISCEPDTSWYVDGVGDSEDNPYIIDSAADMYGLESKFEETSGYAGKYIRVDDDIQLNIGDSDKWTSTTGTTELMRQWTPLGKTTTTAVFAGHFNGNGKTISRVWASDTTTITGLFYQTDTNSTVSDFKLVDSYFYSAGGHVGSLAGYAYGEFTNIYSNATVAFAGNYSGGLVGRVDNGTLTMNNCWYDGKLNLGSSGAYGGGIGGLFLRGTITLNNCLSTAQISTDNKYTIGGFVANLGHSSGVVNVILNNCINACTLEGTTSEYVGGVSYKFTGSATNTNVTYTNVYLDQSFSPYPVQTGTANVTNTANIKEHESFLGSEAYLNTALDFTKDGPWVATVNGTPELRLFAKGEVTYEHVIDNVDEFKEFATVSQTRNFEDWTVKLNADMAVHDTSVEGWMDSATSWTPIGSKSNRFAGVFDGQGHEISGVYLNTTTANVGLFSATSASSVIKDFKLVKSHFENTNENSTAFIGSIVGLGGGTFENIYSNATVKAVTYRIGGFIGRIDTGASYIRNCWYNGELSNGRYMGGIVAEVNNAAVTIEHCLSTAKIYSNPTDENTSLYTGGIIGNIQGTESSVTITDTLSDGTIEFETESETLVGAILGCLTAGEMPDNYAYFTTSTYSASIGQTKGNTVGGKMLEWTADGTIGDLNSTYWTAIEGSTPVLTTFANMLQ